MDAQEMLLVHNTELILAGCVDDLRVVLNALVHNGLGELVFDCGVVRLHEMLLDELHGHGRLADGSGAYHGDFSRSLCCHRRVGLGCGVGSGRVCF